MLSKRFHYNSNRQIALFTGHPTFHSHDHHTDNLRKESCHDNSKQITIAILATTIQSKQSRHYNNGQITFFSGHTTFHSHDHQTDNLLKESRHDNSRQITIASLAIKAIFKQFHHDNNREITLFTGHTRGVATCTHVRTCVREKISKNE